MQVSMVVAGLVQSCRIGHLGHSLVHVRVSDRLALILLQGLLTQVAIIVTRMVQIVTMPLDRLLWIRDVRSGTHPLDPVGVIIES